MLKHFSGTNGDGEEPRSPLLLLPTGILVGTSYGGGVSLAGTVFRLSTDGTSFGLIKSLGGANGANPAGPLVLGEGGILYGSTLSGGLSSAGVLFAIRPDGTEFRVLKAYPATRIDGAAPRAPLLVGAEGTLYGTTQAGGVLQSGTAFKFDLTTGAYTVLCSFTESGGDSLNPTGELIQGQDQALYGTTENGGAFGNGTVYKVNKDGSGYDVLKSFTGTGADGAKPAPGLVLATNGALYGATIYDSRIDLDKTASFRGNGHLFKLDADGTGYVVLKRFTGGADGGRPNGPLLRADDGALYGTTSAGGVSSAGVIFKVKLDGCDYRTLKLFDHSSRTEGYAPYAGLIQGKDRALYGTASSGGSGLLGTVFRLNLDGSAFTVLKHFSGRGGEGSAPWGRLIQGQDGALYGTTSSGGTRNKGTIYRVNPDGTGFLTLKSLEENDGSAPKAALVQAPNGMIFGTTSSGGATTAFLSVGTVFQLLPDGSGFRRLKEFPQLTNAGFLPSSGLLLGSDGALYGTTYHGSRGGNITLSGTVYRLVPAPTLLPPVQNGSSVMVGVRALPGQTISIERTFGEAWTNLGPVHVGGPGFGEFTDNAPPLRGALYRACF